MQVDKKPLSITEGVFVWCKFRNYPFWPAMVKSVNRKQKKASIVFIDDPLTDNKRKGLTVALKTLKPFDCEEANQLVCKAKENYGAAIEWSLELITDYRIRIACGSFTGSFIEYFAHNMSYPVRRKYPQAVSERLTIASEMAMEVQCDNHKEESFIEVQEEVSRSSKRLLPDRTHAAHNRANEKLVHFIVKQRMVERHILAVISGQQQSRWLRSFLSAKRRRVVNIYLEDDEQLDQVYWYLNELYETAPATAPCLADVKFMERVPFVLDVLLPEAIIYAIAGVDNVSVKKAEEKYLKGRCISNRERQEFDWMIEQQMRTKSMRQNTHSYSTSPLLL
ncbi:PWWP domain-containing DNA repair factor 3B-like isoform X3 [Centroberyx affinis]